MSQFTILILIFSIITASLGQLFLRKGALILSDFKFSFSTIFKILMGLFQNKWLLAGTLLFIISFFSYVFILSRVQLSLAYPLTVSAGIILVVIGSQAFLGEHLSLSNIIGITLIIIGILLLAPKG